MMAHRECFRVKDGEGQEKSGSGWRAARTVFVSAKLLTHLHFEWGKQPSPDGPEPCFIESFHLGDGKGPRSHQPTTVRMRTQKGVAWG